MDARTPSNRAATARPGAPDGRVVGGRYTLISSVGAGGMGTVWRASDELLRREVAVKEVLLPPGIPAAERGVLCERTLREARAAAALNHPAVIRVYDVVNDGDRPWIVMELLDAKSVADLLRDEGPLPYDRVAEVGLAVLGALETAHRVGVLHRDVKPGNVLLGNDGRVTLTDFGVARSPNESPLTSTGLLLGSPQYIAPERARGKPFGPSSDLFSLGATLYTAVEGRPPFDRGDPLPTMTAVVCEPPDQMQAAGPLTPVLLGLLEKDPGERWDCDRTRDALRTVLAGGRITALGGGRTPRQSGGDTGRLAGLRRRRDQDTPRDTPAPQVTPPAAAAPQGRPANGWAGNPPMPPAVPGMPPPPPGTPPRPPGMQAGFQEQAAPVSGSATGAMEFSPFSTEGMPSLPPPDDLDEPVSPSPGQSSQNGQHGRGEPRPGSGTARVPVLPPVDQGGPAATTPFAASGSPGGSLGGGSLGGGSLGAAQYRPSGTASVPPVSPAGGGFGGAGPGEYDDPGAGATAPIPGLAGGVPYEQPGVARRTAYLGGAPEQNGQPAGGWNTGRQAGYQAGDTGGWGAPPAAPVGRASAIGGHTITAPAQQGGGWRRLESRTKTIVLVAAAFLAVLLIGVASYLISSATSGTDQADSPDTATGQQQQPAELALQSYPYPNRGFSVSAPPDWTRNEADSYVEFDSQSNEKIRLVVEDASSPRSAVNAAENFQRRLETQGKISDFKTIRKEPAKAKLAGRDTYEWEWTYTDDNGEQRHRLWRVTVADGESYSLYLSVPESRYSTQKPLFDQVTRSFKLTG